MTNLHRLVLAAVTVGICLPVSAVGLKGEKCPPSYGLGYAAPNPYQLKEWDFFIDDCRVAPGKVTGFTGYFGEDVEASRRD